MASIYNIFWLNYSASAHDGYTTAIVQNLINGKREGKKNPKYKNYLSKSTYIKVWLSVLQLKVQ